jgi:hypothetical protein
MSNFINNAILSNQYNKLKYNILGSKTKEDAYFILEKYKLDNKCYNLMVSLINGKKYDRALDYENMKKYIKDIASFKYKEDAYELISHILLQTSDIAQVKTFTRIADMKPNKPQYISMRELKQRNKENYITKKCPHCGYKCFMSKDTVYIVCGYNESGYDWEGCGKDWCFRCGKMLCKNWEIDQLYLPTNRFHDPKCCKKHSLLYGYKYPEDYCRCNNAFVLRNN